MKKITVLIITMVLLMSSFVNAGIVDALIIGGLAGREDKGVAKAIKEVGKEKFHQVEGKKFILLDINIEAEYTEYFWIDKTIGETYRLEVKKTTCTYTWTEPSKCISTPTPDILKEVLKDVYGGNK